MKLNEVLIPAGVLDKAGEDLCVDTAEAGSGVRSCWVSEVLGRAGELRLEHSPVIPDEPDDAVPPRVDRMSRFVELWRVGFSHQVGDKRVSRGGGMNVHARSTALLVQLRVVESPKWT